MTLFRRALPLLLLLCTQLLAQRFTARVVRVIDGDTIVVLAGTTQVRIRLAEIDCPESSQPWGYRAKQFTSALVFGRTVTVLPQDTDRYNRTIAHIVNDQGADLNTELVRAGIAWWHHRYSNSAGLRALEQQARRERRGLWADPDPIAPWDWRRERLSHTSKSNDRLAVGASRR
jgi:endonuclease YncB( thermonuclease family)